MKIGIDCRIYSSKFTGIGRYTHELVANLIKINKEKSTPDELILFFNNPEYHQFNCPENVKKVLVNAKHYSLSEQFRFLLKLRKEKLDIVHFPHFNVPILYRKTYVVTIHDLTLSIFPGHKMTKWYHRMGYKITIKNSVRTARKVIAVSENTKADIIEFLKIPEEKIKVIYNGVGPEFLFLDDRSKLQKTLKKYNITKTFLLYTGVWRSHKNLPRLIKAFNILKNEKRLDLQLVFTGKSDPHYPEVEKTIKKLKLEDDIIRPGLVDEEELVHLYNAAAIYVFPSLYEGFGLPPLEAMKCGTPVAASDSSCIPEICGEKNAVFFDPYKPEDIANKIESLYKDTGLQAELIANGIAHSAKFSWEKTSMETYKIITETK